MAYFDSPKNKAKWEKELSELKEERRLRQSGLSPQAKAERRKQEEVVRIEASYRTRTSFQELMKQETESIRKPRTERNKNMEHSPAMKKDTEIHKKAAEVTK